MNVSEIKVGDTFVTSALPLERAITCGILCTAIDKLPDGKSKVSFRRYSGEESFSFFGDEQGNIQLGNWVPFKDLSSAIQICGQLNHYMERAQQEFFSAKTNIAEIKDQIKNHLTVYKG